jgi:glutamine synthetase
MRFGKDVVAHYVEASRWGGEQLRSPGAVGEWERRRYLDGI